MSVAVAPVQAPSHEGYTYEGDLLVIDLATMKRKEVVEAIAGVTPRHQEGQPSPEYGDLKGVVGFEYSGPSGEGDAYYNDWAQYPLSTPFDGADAIGDKPITWKDLVTSGEVITWRQALETMRQLGVFDSRTFDPDTGTARYPKRVEELGTFEDAEALIATCIEAIKEQRGALCELQAKVDERKRLEEIARQAEEERRAKERAERAKAKAAKEAAESEDGAEDEPREEDGDTPETSTGAPCPGELK